MLMPASTRSDNHPLTQGTNSILLAPVLSLDLGASGTRTATTSYWGLENFVCLQDGAIRVNFHQLLSSSDLP